MDALQPARLSDAGIFDPVAVAGLVRRCRAGLATGVRENQALVAVLSTQLWHQQFVSGHGTAVTTTPLALSNADVMAGAESAVVP